MKFLSGMVDSAWCPERREDIMAQARPGVYLPKCQNPNMFVLVLTALTFVFHMSKALIASNSSIVLQEGCRISSHEGTVHGRLPGFDGLARRPDPVREPTLNSALFYNSLSIYSESIFYLSIYKVKVFLVCHRFPKFGVLKPSDLHHSTLAHNQPMYLPLTAMLTCKKRDLKERGDTGDILHGHSVLSKTWHGIQLSGPWVISPPFLKPLRDYSNDSKLPRKELP